MNTRIAILAGSYEQAQAFATHRRMRSSQWFWPRDPLHADSVPCVEIIVLPSFDTHDYWSGLADWFARKAKRPANRWVPPHLR